MAVNYLKNLKDLFVAVLEASDPVDLFILPGVYFFLTFACNYLPTSENSDCGRLKSIISCYLTSVFILGLAFDRCGRRLGRGGG